LLSFSERPRWPATQRHLNDILDPDLKQTDFQEKIRE
jgi:hypothetical protein